VSVSSTDFDLLLKLLVFCLQCIPTTILSLFACIGFGDIYLISRFKWCCFLARIDFVISLFAALRGATTLKARTTKDACSFAAVTPYDQGTSCQSISFSGELIEEGVKQR